MNNIKKNSGYTLIELLVIIVFIGIITAIIYPNFIGYTEKATEEVIVANMRTLMTEIRVYRHENGIYPEADDANDFINDYRDEWVSVYKIEEEIGDYDLELYKFDSEVDNYIFSVKVSGNNFVGISSFNGLERNLDNHLDLP